MSADVKRGNAHGLKTFKSMYKNLKTFKKYTLVARDPKQRGFVTGASCSNWLRPPNAHKCVCRVRLHPRVTDSITMRGMECGQFISIRISDGWRLVRSGIQMPMLPSLGRLWRCSEPLGSKSLWLQQRDLQAGCSRLHCMWRCTVRGVGNAGMR